jgi:hypothetical protein
VHAAFEHLDCVAAAGEREQRIDRYNHAVLQRLAVASDALALRNMPRWS